MANNNLTDIDIDKQEELAIPKDLMNMINELNQAVRDLDQRIKALEK